MTYYFSFCEKIKNVIILQRICAVILSTAILLCIIPSFLSLAQESTSDAIDIKCGARIKYVPENNIICGIEPNTPTDEIYSYFNNPGSISLDSKSTLATGDKLYVNNKHAANLVIYGDCNGDSLINGHDVLHLRKVLVKLEPADNASLLAADLHKDGKVNLKDVLYLRKYCAGLVKIRNSSLYYVSKDGNDNSDGTEDKPFLTIQKAADILTAGDTCIIKEGVYRETIKPKNSGMNGAPITFTAYKNDKVVISGNETVKGTWEEYKNGIYKIEHTLWRGDENQIFVNGKSATLCRYPNKNTDSFISVGDTISATSASDSYANTSTIPFTQNELIGAKIAIQGTSHYLYYSSTITQNTSTSLNYNKLNSGWDSPTDDSNFYLYDKLCLLDDENEWYYEDGTIYYKPEADVDINSLNIECSIRGQAFDVRDKSYITISGLELNGANVQNNEGSTHLTLDSNKIFYFYHSNITRHYPWEADWWGVELHGSDSVVKNCEIAYGAEGGVIIYGNNCSVVNNYIHDVNYINSNAAAIEPKRCEYTLISHNTIKNVGRTAIICTTKNLRVCNNDISNCGVNTNDVSGIGTYKFDAEGTVEIDHNIVHDCNDERMFVAYYLDNGSLNYTVHHNVAYNVDHAMIINNPSYNNKIYNNTFADCGKIATGNLQNPFEDNKFIGSVWTGNQFYNNIMPSVYYGDGAYFDGNLYADNSEINFGKNFSISNGSPAANSGVETAIDNNKYVGAYAPNTENWACGHDFSNEFQTEFSLSDINESFVPQGSDIFEEINNISGQNLIDENLFGGEKTIRQGWIEQTIDVKPGEIYYISCNARFVKSPETYMEYGIHYLDNSFNITSQGGFLFTQNKTSKLETLITIPENCYKMRYFAAIWSNNPVECKDFKLIKYS